MAQDTISFAVIGAGMLARSLHLPNLLQTDVTTLHTCCDLDEKALQECRAIAPDVKLSTDYRAVIHDPEVEALIVATTEKFRVPIIEEAAKAGKPVYCEKPLAKNLEEALEIERLVEASGIPFCVGHNRRCSPAMVDAQRIFAAHMKAPGACGWRYNREGAGRAKLDHEDGIAAMSIRINDDWWSWKNVHLQGQNAEIGLMLSEDTHFMDIAAWFMQAEPVEVMTTFSGILVHQISVKFEGGHIASILSSANGSFGYPKELYEAIGRGGVVAVDHMVEVRTAGIEGAPLITTYPMLRDRHPAVGTEGGLHGWLKKKEAACSEASAGGDMMKQFTAEPDKGHARMLREFVREIRGEREPVSPVQDAVRAVRMCLAAVKSKREGRPVALSEIHC
ncbi:MAG TPA: Gfo/Idh/MocA family oxidoreductase [Chthoniobacteraceae bacterium]|nr:Gfo/Idh/MocA family oxidoreductase [Chthoniobacteraceae bacterium]